MTKSILQLKKVNKTFNETTDFAVKVLQNFDLEIAEGEFVTIVGSNGTGKSTLFRVVTGQIAPDSGEIFLEDKKINGEKEYKISKYISQVKQQPNDNLVMSLTLFENLCLAKLRSGHARLFFGNTTKYPLSSVFTPKGPYAFVSWVFSSRHNKMKLRQEFEKVLRELGIGLEKRLDDLVSLFSGGQKQAIALIMATLNNPKVLLLDEHTASLDPVNSEKIMSLTKKIVEEKQIATLMITHNIAHAIQTGGRLLMLSKGKVKLDIHGEDKENLTIEGLIKSLHHEHLELETDFQC